MILDKNGKIGGKVSIVDIAAIVLVIAVIAGICVRYGSHLTTAIKSNETFEYVIKVQNVRTYTAEALKKGGNITDKHSDKVLGKIKDVQIEDAHETKETADGKIIEAYLPERTTCYVTIEAQGKESDNVYIMADSTELSVGKHVDLYSQYCKTSGVIKEVKKVS